MERSKAAGSVNSNGIIWQGSPTHWVNLHIYMAYVVVIVMLTLFQDSFSSVLSGLFGSPQNFNIAYGMIYIFITGVIVFRTVENHMHSYEMTDEVLREKYGVFNRITNELELYRVSDSATFRPFHLMIFGFGNVIVSATDRSSPTTYIKGIRGAEDLRLRIRKHAEIMRQKRGIVEVAN